MTVTKNCLKDFKQKCISMPKFNYINQELPGRFSEIAKENSESLNTDAASPKPQHTEQKESNLLKITREDYLKVKQVIKTASFIHFTTYKEHAVTSLDQISIKQHSVIALLTANFQSQCVLSTSVESPSHIISPVHRIKWWIKFVKCNYAKLGHNSSELFMSLILNPENACLILR